VDWCFFQYSAFYNATGLSETQTSTFTDTIFALTSSVVGTSTSFDTFPNETTIVTRTTASLSLPPGVTYTPPPQCMQGCIIQAARVGLQYWPTPGSKGEFGNATLPATITPAPVVTAIVDGKTLYSPSNYLVFTNISAENCPWDPSPCTTIGAPVEEVTLSFAQSELLTDNCFHQGGTIDYRDFNSPVPWSIVSNQPGCTLISESHPGNEPDFGFTVLPNIQYPDELKTGINPAWASCSFILDVFDPPSALSSVAPITHAPNPSTTNALPSAAPVSIAAPTTASPTVAPAPPPSSIVSSTSTNNPDQPQAPPPPDPPASDPSQLPVSPELSSSIVPQVPNSPINSEPATSVVNPNNDPAPANPGTTAPAPAPTQTPVPSVHPVIPNVPSTPPGQDPSPLIGSIIASLGGINPPAPNSPDPVATIVLPGPAATSELITTIQGITTTLPGTESSLAGVIITIPGQVKTESAQTITNSPALSPSVTAIIAGQTIIIAPNGGSAVVNPFSAAQTLTAGGSPITVSSTVISLGPSDLVIGSSTIALSTPTRTGASASFVGFNITTALPSQIQVSSGSSIIWSFRIGVCLLLQTVWLVV